MKHQQYQYSVPRWVPALVPTPRGIGRGACCIKLAYKTEDPMYRVLRQHLSAKGGAQKGLVTVQDRKSGSAAAP